MMGRALLMWESALVFLHVLSGAAILTEFAESRWVGLFVVLVSGAQAATAYYRRGASQKPVEA